MQLLIWFIITVICSTTVLPITAQQSCTFLAQRKKPYKRSHLSTPIFADDSFTPAIMYPNCGNSICVGYGTNIVITCSRRFIHLYINKITTKTNFQAVTAQCQGGNIFKILETNETIDINIIYCMENPIHIAKYVLPYVSCTGRGLLAEIGFQVKDTFLRQIELCFDPMSQLAFYSTHTMSPLTGTLPSNTSSDFIPNSFHNLEEQGVLTGLWLNSTNISSEFIPDSFYNLGGQDIDTFYTKGMEIQTINALLGLPYNDDRYIKNDGNHYLARGHLSPVADFFYPIEQDATYHFINAVPHWQIINNGNWKLFEKDLRNLNALMIQNKLKPLQVKTGFADITELPHLNGAQVPIYLYNREKMALPVPSLIWKVFHEPYYNKMVVVFCTNNPYLSKLVIKEKYLKCEGKELKLRWLTVPDPENITKGFIYACDYNEILENYPNFPIFN